MSPSERQRSHAASLLALAPDHPDPHGRRPRPRRPRSPRPNRPLRPDVAQRRAARGAAARLPRSASGMSERPRLVGINHVALEVGDLEQALEFYGSVFEISLRGREPGMAF